MSEDQNDMKYWLPILEKTGVPTPPTKIITTDCELIHLLDGKEPDGIKTFTDPLKAAAEEIGYPVFLRTGYGSGKHDWKNTCYVEKPEDLLGHMCQLVEWSYCVDFFGLPVGTWAVRKFIPMYSSFKAFADFPVNRERRYFFKDHKIVCKHPYWPPFAIEGHTKEPDWETKLAQLNAEGSEEVKYLNELATKVAEAFDGFWSIDFSMSAEGQWYAIDMALGQRSFHWPGCPHGNATAQPELDYGDMTIED